MTLVDLCVIASERPPTAWSREIVDIIQPGLTIFGPYRAHLRPSIGTLDDPTLADWLVHLDLSPSKGQARTSIKQGAVRINGERRVCDPNYRLTLADVLGIGCVVFECGKWNYGVLHVDEVEGPRTDLLEASL